MNFVDQNDVPDMPSQAKIGDTLVTADAVDSRPDDISKGILAAEDLNSERHPDLELSQQQTNHARSEIIPLLKRRSLLSKMLPLPKRLSLHGCKEHVITRQEYIACEAPHKQS